MTISTNAAPDTAEMKAVGAFLAAMHDNHLDGGKMREAMIWALGASPTTQAAPTPAVQQVDALPREDFAWMVVQEACETDPADEDDPECIRILRRDLKSAVLAAFLRDDAARAAKEGA